MKPPEAVLEHLAEDPIDVLARGLMDSDLIRRYIDYADRIPTMRYQTPRLLARSWAEHILAAIPEYSLVRKGEVRSLGYSIGDALRSHLRSHVASRRWSSSDCAECVAAEAAGIR